MVNAFGWKCQTWMKKCGGDDKGGLGLIYRPHSRPAKDVKTTLNSKKLTVEHLKAK